MVLKRNLYEYLFVCVCVCVGNGWYSILSTKLPFWCPKGCRFKTWFHWRSPVCGTCYMLNHT